MQSDKSKPKKYLSSGDMSQRYGRHVRTIERWTDAGILPPPIRINGYRYWDEAEVVLAERDQERGSARKRPQQAAVA